MLRKYFPALKLKTHEGRYGLEIETEVPTKRNYPDGFITSTPCPETGNMIYALPATMPDWVGHHDGSLRNFGVEFVFKKPLSLEDSSKALDDFAEATKGVKFIREPAAGSVHVHVNVSDFQLRELGNFLFLWTLLENVYVGFCSDFRQANLFALPTRCAETTFENIVSMFVNLERGRDRAVIFDMNSVKYGALNLSSLSRFGSLEIRTLEGTTDVSRIKTWLGMIDRLYETSRRDVTPLDLLQEYRESPSEFLTAFFEGYHSYLDEKGVDLPSAVRRNLWYAGSIVEAVKDWRGLEGIFPTKKARPTIDNSWVSVYQNMLPVMNEMHLAFPPAPIPAPPSEFVIYDEFHTIDPEIFEEVEF